MLDISQKIEWTIMKLQISYETMLLQFNIAVTCQDIEINLPDNQITFQYFIEFTPSEATIIFLALTCDAFAHGFHFVEVVFNVNLVAT